ncbi:sterol carrier protein 2-like [Tubulanus polymorphus]|uniref:sterol carrier protein 2-like n=1 Tax=Tubulanus polymorphus TaxID=672921 RepID=UPI003DA4165A
MAAPRKIFVVGVGMTKFEKPGRRDDFDYPEMALEAGKKALADANIPYNEIQQVCVGYVYGDSTCGQRAVYQLGMTGVPIYNVNNNCATGSTALIMGKQFIEGGSSNCVMVLGFEKMQKGSLSSTFDDRTNPMDKHVELMADTHGIEPRAIMPQMFGNAGREHMKKYGTKPEIFAKIAYKNHKHSVNNPYSQFRKEYTLEEIMQSPMIHEPLTKLQCCPTSDGSAAAILASEEFVIKHGLQDKAVEIVAMEMATDLPTTFEEQSCLKAVGYDMTRHAAEKAFKKAGLKPTDVDVVELHDCFSANELISYEALGLCSLGEGGKLVENNDNTYGGKYVINPSGGLISKGHPLGATGIAQCAELCWQLRGLAGQRQVKNAQIALQHNVGLGGAVVVGLYTKPQLTDSRNKMKGSSTSGGNSGGNDGSNFKCAPIFEEIKKGLKQDGANIVKKMKGVFVFKVTNGPNGKDGVWVVDVKNGSGSVTYGGKAKGDVTITMADEDMLKLMLNKLNPQKAFFQGKLKISGNMGLAYKLKEFQPKTKKAKL